MNTLRVRFGLFITLAMAMVFLAACEGSEGPAGPAGPAGLANVISGRDTLRDADWSASTISTTYRVNNWSAIFRAPARYADVAVPEITADVVEHGAVLIWMAVDGLGSDFTPLPYVFVRNAFNDYTWRYDVQITEGSLRFLFLYERMDMNTSLPDPLAAEQADRIFRWVILPPGEAGLASSLPLEDGADATLMALAERGVEVQSSW